MILSCYHIIVLRVIVVKISKAISFRIRKLCDEKKISINKLALDSELTQSTLQSIMSGTSKNSTFLTVARVCDTLKIELKDL